MALSFHVLSISGNNIVVDNIKDTSPWPEFQSSFLEEKVLFKIRDQVHHHVLQLLQLQVNCWHVITLVIWGLTLCHPGLKLTPIEKRLSILDDNVLSFLL